MFYLVDKPLGLSGFDVIRSLRKKFNIKKMGHTGTLDPLASGLLLIATENSTKLIPALEGCDKTYSFTVRLDGTSESLDCGTVISPVDTSSLIEISDRELITRLSDLSEQIPPKYSALHIDGVRAYDLARGGQEFEIPKRKITIQNAEIIERKNWEISLRLRISSGGYIRSLAPQIAEWLGIQGGYISFLRREILHLPGGDVSLAQSSTLDMITPEMNIPYTTLFSHFQHHTLSKEEKEMLLQGKNISLGDTIQGNILLSHDDFVSWCHCENNSCKIVKNNV